MEDTNEDKLFATFEPQGEFLDTQKALLNFDLYEKPSPGDEKKESLQLSRLSSILDEYQEQSYLLDPFLEDLVAPLVEHLKSFARTSISDRSRQACSSRVERIATLLYSYIKCRGYKTIIRFFPHEIADLSIAKEFMLDNDGLTQQPSNWALRYVVLLWLSLICMIPFDLAQFDEDGAEGSTAKSLESLAKGYLGKAGLEREGAAILLSRLYMRKDTQRGFKPFLDWSYEILKQQADVFTTIGILQVLCEVTKSGSVEQVQSEVPKLFAIGATIDATAYLCNNTLIRKFTTKLSSRIGIRLLPVQSKVNRRKERLLGGIQREAVVQPLGNDIEVSEDVETVLGHLLSSLQDKDTIVRWAAAKGVARIAERLPPDFATQVFENVMGLFEIHSIAAASLYDLPAIAESTWHGACLACAEMARRSLVAPEKLPELIDWLSKALYFDLRKGAHSIGSNVRDAAAYVLWALARSEDPSSLSPYAVSLARRLITVALYDREIHIRRAASASFQEHVGRTNLFPHGIDVLAKTDFYAVSIRRNSFLVAAPQVAEHFEYLEFLFDHLLDVTLRHWDLTMRELGSQSLRLICMLNLSVLGPLAVLKAARLLESVDLADRHGGLLALNEISIAYLEQIKDAKQLESYMRGIFKFLAQIPEDVMMRPRNELVASAACRLISNSITLTEIQLKEKSSVPKWRMILDSGLKHRSASVQEAAADAFAAVSKLEDCSADISRFIQQLKAGSPTIQQSLARLLGVIDYNTFPNKLGEAVNHLQEVIKSSPKLNVETRKQAYLSIPRIIITVLPNLTTVFSSSVFRSLFNTLLEGLDDYTIDERGDVGSWVRMACIKGLTTVSVALISKSASISDFEQFLPPKDYHSAVTGILKQGVERLDNVRQEVGDCFRLLLALPAPAVEHGERWMLPGMPLLNELFAREDEAVGWNDGVWLFPRAVRLLEVEPYRKSLLLGIVTSLASKTDSTQRPMATSLANYVQTLPIVGGSPSYSLFGLVSDLTAQAKSQITSNAVVIPIFQTINVLLESNCLQRLAAEPEGLESMHIVLSIASRNITKIKSVQRVHEAMKIIVNLLTFDALFQACVPLVRVFLEHPFPRIRADTAEYLYLALQSLEIDVDTEDVETVLLETEWSSNDESVFKTASAHITQLFYLA